MTTSANQSMISRKIRRSRSPAEPVCQNRGGFSLLEVILAIGILAGASVLTGSIIRQGLQNTAAARDLTKAQIYCQSKLAEIAAGIEAAGPASDIPLDKEGKWVCSITTEPVGDYSLLAVTVTVNRVDKTGPRQVSYSLTQWIVDPESETATESGDASETSTDSAASSASSSAGTGP